MKLAAVLFAIVVVMWCAVVAIKAKAQDGHHGQGHAQHHDWYKDLKQPAAPSHSCCTKADGKEGDCRPVRAYWDEFAERWMALVDGSWEPVPPRVVIQDDSLNKEPFTAHACVSKTRVWYCFLRKNGGT